MLEGDGSARMRLLDEVERLLARGDGAAAMQALQSSVPGPDAGVPLGLRHAELLDACGQSVRALLHLQSMCARDGSVAAVWMELGFMLLRLERLEAAGRAFERAVDRAPQDPLGWEALASIEQAMGRTVQAKQIWD